jgi:hypothetical protein
MPKPSHVLLALLLFDLCFGLAYLAAGGVGGVWFRFLDFDREANMPTWYSSAKYLIASCAAMTAYFVGVWTGRRSYSVVLIAALLLLLSADETAMLHERLGALIESVTAFHRQGSVLPVTGFWMFFVGLPAACVILAVVNISLKDLSLERKAALRLAAGLGVIVVAATGVELLSNVSKNAAGHVSAQVFFEEMMEFVGASIVLWACYGLLHTRFSQAFRAQPGPKTPAVEWDRAGLATFPGLDAGRQRPLPDAAAAPPGVTGAPRR